MNSGTYFDLISAAIGIYNAIGAKFFAIDYRPYGNENGRKDVRSGVKDVGEDDRLIGATRKRGEKRINANR